MFDSEVPPNHYSQIPSIASLRRSSQGMETKEAATLQLREELDDSRAVALPPAGRSILKSPRKARSPGGNKRQIRYHPSVLVWEAAENEDETELVRILKKQDVDTKESSDDGRSSPYRPELGLDLNMSNHEGVTLLHLLCFTGSASAIRILLEKGADPNLADREGWTALHVAAATRQMNIFQLLIENGAHMPPLSNSPGRLGLASVSDDKDILLLCVRFHQRRGAHHRVVVHKRLVATC